MRLKSAADICDDYRELSHIYGFNDLTPHSRVMRDGSGVIFEITADPGYAQRLTLDIIVSTDRFSGKASAWLATLCQVCDANAVSITLQAAPFSYPVEDGIGNDEGLEFEDLIQFYEKFGFERYPTADKGYWMRRLPDL